MSLLIIVTYFILLVGIDRQQTKKASQQLPTMAATYIPKVSQVDASVEWKCTHIV
jgi:hypothetical protein